MSRSAVTNWFEVAGLLLLAAAAGVYLWARFGPAAGLAGGGVSLVAESLLLSLVAPRPTLDTRVEAG